jgi:lipopolysaccharide transport system permease protein
MSLETIPLPSSVADCANEGGRPLPVTVIEPRRGWQLIDFAEIWRYRELLYFLAWRDVKVRYKQTVLGASWAVLQPLATMIVFSMVLGRVASAPNAEVPYPLFVFAGLLPWLFFSGAMGSAGHSVIGNQNLITKVYFPRLIVPMSAVGTSAVDFVIAFVMLLALMIGYQVLPGWGFLAVPLIFAGLAITALGFGILLAALTVTYRDFRQVIPFLTQLWMFATPSIYVQSRNDILSGSARWLLHLNPVEGLVGSFRAAVLGLPIDPVAVMTSSLFGITVLVVGCVYFRHTERKFADVI